MWIWVFLLFSVAFGKAQACGGEVKETSGHITSPGFPEHYPHNLLCIWEITAPPKHRITLKFNELFLESTNCGLDSLEIHDSRLRTFYLRERFCGMEIPPPITSNENSLKIVFRTDGSISRPGFNVSFTVIDNSITEVEPKEPSKIKNVQWLINYTRSRNVLELPRVTLALFLAEPGFFAPENKTGAELRDKLTICLLAHINKNTTIRSQELALYVQALLVTCQDPSDFYGRDLVSELRARVDQHSTYTNPLEILALCNAGGSVSPKDVEKVSAAFDSRHRPFWTDVQAMATMALQCLSSKMAVDDRVVRDMQDELKKRQFRNGSVENIVTTALVVQALNRNGSLVEFFDLPSALEVLLSAQREDGSWGGSVRNSFYLLPALSGRSLLDIGHAHCPKITKSEDESLARLQEFGGGRDSRWLVQYSVWLGSDVDLGRTWRLRMPSNTSFYDVMETVSKLDSRHNVTYQVVEGKPYVRSMLGKDDDPELDIFWFTYVRPANSTRPPTLVESSPADVLVTPNQELIMWYRPNTWGEDRV